MTHDSDITSHENGVFEGNSHAIFTGLLNVLIVPDEEKLMKATKRSGKAATEILQELYSNKNRQQPHPSKLNLPDILSIYRPNYRLIYLYSILRKRGVNICLFTDFNREEIDDLLSSFNIDPNIFSSTFFAQEIGMQKADAILFLNLIASSFNNGNITDSIYIDDKKENCLKASSLPPDTDITVRNRHSVGMQFDLFLPVEFNNTIITDRISSSWGIPLSLSMRSAG